MKNLLIVLHIIIGTHTLYAQTNLVPLQNQDTLYVSDIKTTHLLFEETIEYLDLGSPFFVADTLQQLVKLKHIGKGFKNGSKSKLSNLTVITKNGNYYSFTLQYDRSVNVSSYRIKESNQVLHSRKEKQNEEQKETEILSTLCSRLENQEEDIILTSKKGDLKVKVTGLFYRIDDTERIIVRLQLINESTINFNIDHILFRSKLGKPLKRNYIYQERVIEPLYSCHSNLTVEGGGQLTKILVFDKFAINKNEKLQIDILEKDGGRSSEIRIPRKKLLEPKVI